MLTASYLDAGHVDHAYALTGHRTQGLTAERAFVLAGGDGELKEWGYVALSRARGETRLYTSAPDLEIETPPGYRPEPPAPLDRLAEAFTRSAARPLALDSERAEAPGERARLIGQMRELVARRQELERERAQMARNLHDGERTLERLGLFGRARHGPRLRAQAAEGREALARTDAQIARLERELRAARERALAASRPTLERGRERKLARGREPGLELGL